MNELKIEIKSLSSRAAQLSKEAQTAFAAKNYSQGKSLMKEAVDAGRKCQNLIQEYTQQEIIQVESNY